MIRSSYIVFKPNKNIHRLIKNTMTHVNERQHILRMPTIMDSKTGVVDKWIKKEGDIVRKSEIICEATLSDLTIGFIKSIINN